jgi:site-specific DNA-methyltransferase (adenine-specific)
VARKPIDGTVANNVLKWGTGGINIDACRVPLNGDKPYSYPNGSGGSHGPVPIRIHYDNPVYGNPQGRFPANLIHDGSDEVVALFPVTKGSASPRTNSGKGNNCYGDYETVTTHNPTWGDTGSASRFFYCAKASRSERGEGNNHPTVKPLALMRYLCRLVTPPDGVVLDPFCGSGSTLVGALQEGFRYIGIEKDPDYVNIAYARTKHALKEWGRESRQQVLQEVVS